MHSLWVHPCNEKLHHNIWWALTGMMETLTFYLTFTSPSEFYNTFSYSNDWIGRCQWVWFNLTILLRWDNTTDFWFHMGHEQRSPRWKFFDQIFLSGPRLMTSSFAAIILLQPLEGTPWKYTNLTCDTLVWSFYLIRTGSTSTLSFLSPHISPSKTHPVQVCVPSICTETCSMWPPLWQENKLDWEH